MDELPHLKDDTEAVHNKEVIHKANEVLALEETVMEESVLEGAAICVALAALAFMPQLLHM